MPAHPSPPRLTAPAALERADKPHVGVVDEAGEDSDRVRAASNRGDHDLGQPALDLQDLRADSRPITACSSRTISGYGAGRARANQIVGSSPRS